MDAITEKNSCCVYNKRLREFSNLNIYKFIYLLRGQKKNQRKKDTYTHIWSENTLGSSNCTYLRSINALYSSALNIFYFYTCTKRIYESFFELLFNWYTSFFYSRSLFLVFTVPCITYFECQIPSRCVWQSTTYIYMCVTISDSVHNVKVYYLLFIRVIHENWKQRQQQRKFTQIKSQSTFVSFEFLYGFSEPNNWRKKNCHFALLFFFFGDFCALWKSVENPYHKYWCVTNFSLFVRRTAISEQ